MKNSTHGHKSSFQTVRGLGHQSFAPARLFIAVGLQHESPAGVVQLLIAALAADNRFLCRGPDRLDVRVIAAQRRERVPYVRLTRLGMGRHAELGARPDAVPVTHATHPLSLERSWKINRLTRVSRHVHEFEPFLLFTREGEAKQFELKLGIPNCTYLRTTVNREKL